MKKIVLFFGIITFPVHAEIFKCPDKSGKVAYQTAPCKSGSEQKILKINVDNSPRALLIAEERSFFERLMSGDEKATAIYSNILDSASKNGGDRDALSKAYSSYWDERWANLEKMEQKQADAIQRSSDKIDRIRQQQVVNEQLRLQREANEIARERLRVEERRELGESLWRKY